jgi:hypothetical protein
MDYPSKMMFPTKKISFIAVMTSLCISTNYILIGIPNVKLMDLLVFVSGYTMGSLAGALVGVLTWLVYGTLNPYGFNLPTLIVTSTGESIYGIVGGLSMRLGLRVSSQHPKIGGEFLRDGLKLGVLGFLITFVYDLFTNIVTAFVFGVPILAWIIVGAPFTIAHEVSNFFFFFIAGGLLINAVRKLTSTTSIGGEES